MIETIGKAEKADIIDLHNFRARFFFTRRSIKKKSIFFHSFMEFCIRRKFSCLQWCQMNFKVTLVLEIVRREFHFLAIEIGFNKNLLVILINFIRRIWQNTHFHEFLTRNWENYLVLINFFRWIEKIIWFYWISSDELRKFYGFMVLFARDLGVFFFQFWLISFPIFTNLTFIRKNLHLEPHSPCISVFCSGCNFKKNISSLPKR